MDNSSDGYEAESYSAISGKKERFSVEMEEKLIELVSKSPYLYDKSHKLFRDRDIKVQTWEEFAAILGVSESVKKKWGYLRDQFVRHLKAEVLYGQKILPRHRTFAYFDIMHFLMPTYKPKIENVKLPWDNEYESFEQVYVPSNLPAKEETSSSSKATDVESFATTIKVEPDTSIEICDEQFLDLIEDSNPYSALAHAPTANAPTAVTNAAPQDDNIIHFLRNVEGHLRVANFTTVELLGLQSGILDLIRESIEKR